MKRQFTHSKTFVAAAGLLALAGCGGGGSGSSATTSVATKVIDGALQGATVCMDLNNNGVCDAGEPSATTAADGSATLKVPNADVGKYPIIASVGTNATDAVYGPVSTPYTLSAPADQTGVISPLTTLVQQMVASSGVSTVAADSAIQTATGLSGSVLADYTQASTAAASGGASPAEVARLLVLYVQQQSTALASAVGTTATDGSTITQADLATAIQQTILQQLPTLVGALDAAVQSAGTSPSASALDGALASQATTLVQNSTLSPAALQATVALNNQISSGSPSTAGSFTPAPWSQLVALNYSDAGNYFMRSLTGSLAQDTPDANNNIGFVDRRQSANTGHVATWSFGSSPTSSADLHWNGSAWVATSPPNFASTSSLRNAQGFSSYNYGDGFETGSSVRTSIDISGKTLASVYQQVRDAGYTNISIADATVLGTTATFPSGSQLFYQITTPLTEAYAYYPGGAYNPAGWSNAVAIYSSAVSGGGIAASQPAGQQCNSSETATRGHLATTLDAMIAAETGTPCIFGQGSFTYAGATYTSPASNEWWSNSTVSLGTLGSAPVDSGATAPGYFSGNTLLRVAFSGTGANAVTYYACQQRFTDGSVRNCTAIGSGSYSITTLGDGRVMSFSNLPAQAAPLSYNRVFVERGGAVYYGFQNKPLVANSARFNTVAATALLAQLGLTADDPSVPMALTAGSYEGFWDTFGGTTPPATPGANQGVGMYLNPNGSSYCYSVSGKGYNCTITITDPGSGAFTYSDATGTASGNFNFLAGSGSGTYNNTSLTPSSGPFVAYRR
ncbi:MAG: hypothetical protein KGL43_12745 [Burkholderiales bacterium]|nr:hypothetical protein [Burkholderiales bacterium]